MESSFFVILPLHSKRGTYVHCLVYNLNIDMWEATSQMRGECNEEIRVAHN